jgi:histidinol-phosphate aminotransferase
VQKKSALQTKAGGKAVLPAERFFLALKEKGILVRYFKKPRIDNYLRISIGTDEDMDTFLRIVKEI